MTVSVTAPMVLPPANRIKFMRDERSVDSWRGGRVTQGSQQGFTVPKSRLRPVCVTSLIIAPWLDLLAFPSHHFTIY